MFQDKSVAFRLKYFQVNHSACRALIKPMIVQSRFGKVDNSLVYIFYQSHYKDQVLAILGWGAPTDIDLS